MTEQEAIAVLKRDDDRMRKGYFCINDFIAIEVAKKALEEVQQYREIGTVEKIKEELDRLRNDNECQGLYFTLEERQDLARQHRELEEYRAIGTVEELQKAEKQEDILKFYYCDSEDSYLVGLRIGNFYYAHYIDGRWVFDMSRHLPWGEHVVDDTSALKEHTYPSEPREINFSEWLNGFIKKECGGTPEECMAAVEKQKAKKPKLTIIKHGKHKWERDEKGYIDEFAFCHDNHNGVVCEVCGKTVCVHCDPNYDELIDCEEKYWNCPCCGKKIYSKSKFCDCGQKLY